MPQVSHWPPDSQWVRSLGTARRPANSGTVCSVTALLVDPRVAAGTSGPGRNARWSSCALGALLTTTAVLYLWDLSASGFGNTFYAAAAQAGSKSWSGRATGAAGMSAS